MLKSIIVVEKDTEIDQVAFEHLTDQAQNFIPSQLVGL